MHLATAVDETLVLSPPALLTIFSGHAVIHLCFIPSNVLTM